jgi:hypothetical protein
MLADWVYATGVSFNSIQHPLLQAALKKLHPGATVPTEHNIRNKLLDEAYNQSLSKLSSSLTGQMCTLTTDAWTDTNGESVINYMAVAGKNSFFLESHYTKAQSHDSSFLAEDIERIFDKYNFLEFCAVVTDNTSTNKRMWEMMQSKFPRMFFHGCACHVLHLLVKDVVKALPWLTKLEQGCKKMVKLFRFTHKLRSDLRGRQTNQSLPALAIPGATRWGSLLKCFDTVLASEQCLYEIVSGRDFLVANTKKKKMQRRAVHDFVREKEFVPLLSKFLANLHALTIIVYYVEKAVKVLGVWNKYLQIYEKDSTPLSAVYDIFEKMPDDFVGVGLTVQERVVVTRLIAERFNFLYGDGHGVAYLLDPRYCGAQMDDDTRENVTGFVSTWHGETNEPDVVVELARFFAYSKSALDKKSTWLTAIVEHKVTVLEHWQGDRRFPLLREIALRVFSASCSSSASERNFSTHAFVHSKLRNRLASDRVEKLVHVYFNGRVTADDEEDLQLIDEFETRGDETESEEEEDPRFADYVC